MFKNTSHLNLSVPQMTAIRNVATGTAIFKKQELKKERKKERKYPFSRVKEQHKIKKNDLHFISTYLEL